MQLSPDFEAEFWLKHTSSLKYRKRKKIEKLFSHKSV